MPLFEVVGIGKNTNRRRIKRYKAKDEEQARSLAELDGTTPGSISLLIPEAATERQVKYATYLGLSFPKDITVAEMSHLISRKVDEDIESPAWLRRVALEQFPEENGLAITEYIGLRMLLGFLIQRYIQQDDTNALVRLFLYAVINDLTDSKWRVPFSQLADESVISPLVVELSQNLKVVTSIKRYRIENLVFFGQQTDSEGYLNTGGSRTTIAFQAASSLLTTRGILPERASTSRTYRLAVQSSIPSKKKSGCFVAVVCALLLLSILVLRSPF